MKTKVRNSSKCIWTAVIAAVAVCMTMSASADPPSPAHPGGPPPAANLGSAYVSDVTSGSNCFYSDTNGGGIQAWDIQAGGTYTVTLTGVTDCANLGNDPSIGVVVHNSNELGVSNNIYVLANQVTVGGVGVVGVYTFTITLGSQCLTMPIEYCTHGGTPDAPGNYPGSGMFAQDNIGGAPGGHQGHLRTTIFDSNCVKQGDDDTCQSGPPQTGTITVCKFYDKNANGNKDTGEDYLAGWPFCIDPLDNANPQLTTQTTGSGGCVTWSNLSPGTYQITEANANESNWFHAPAPPDAPFVSTMIPIDTDHLTPPSVNFGNYCTSPSGGLTLGFWSNKNGNKILTGSLTGNGTTLLPAVVTLLNSCQLVNANGTIHTFTNVYSAFKTWLLGANATNMAYMLSAQLATLKLDVAYAGVDGNAFDLCSKMTINGLISAACDTMTGPGNQYTLAGNPSRPGQEMLKNCIDLINNNGAVVPVTPCPYTFPTTPAPCP
jgi:hypothetical protein